MTTPTTNAPHISEVRNIMFEQMRALRSAKPEDIEGELKRSKAMSELGQTMINSAKAEIDYLQLTKQDHSPFLEVPPTVHTGTAPGITRNSADDIKPKVTRTNWVGMVEQ